jgi:SAM-dependent methyltransferase
MYHMRNYTGPHDYFDEGYVKEWVSEANSKRPFRREIFDTFVSLLSSHRSQKILDVGSGPGFLAERVLTECEVTSYHLFDFSPHMLELSRARLKGLSDLVVFHQGSFLDEGWWQDLPATFDAIVSCQAIHEVRDSARIPRLYVELRDLLRPGGVLLIADEVNDGDKREKHLLNVNEHETALLGAGFDNFRCLLAVGDLVLFTARRS